MNGSFTWAPTEASKQNRAVLCHAIARAAGKTLLETRELIANGCLGFRIVKSCQYSREGPFASFYDDDAQPSSIYNKFAQDHQDFLQRDNSWAEVFATYCGIHIQHARNFWMVRKTRKTAKHNSPHNTGQARNRRGQGRGRGQQCCDAACLEEDHTRRQADQASASFAPTGLQRQSRICLQGHLLWRTPGLTMFSHANTHRRLRNPLLL